MTGVEFEQCRQLAEKWWPGIGWELHPDVLVKFRHIPYTAGKRAIELLVDSRPERYPTPTAFLAACRDAVKGLPKVAENPETCVHVFGVLDEFEQSFERERQSKLDSLRLGVCTLCHLESWGVHRVGSDPKQETAA
jgi:hypothetical protein